MRGIVLCSSDTCAKGQMAEGCRALSLQTGLFISLVPVTLDKTVMTVLVDILWWGECFWVEQWTVCIGSVQHGCEDLHLKPQTHEVLPATKVTSEAGCSEFLTLMPESPALLTERLSMKSASVVHLLEGYTQTGLLEHGEDALNWPLIAQMTNE